MMVLSSAVPKPWVVGHDQVRPEEDLPDLGQVGHQEQHDHPDHQDRVLDQPTSLGALARGRPRRTGGARVETLIAKLRK